MNPAMRFKKIVRPLIPDRLMARYRLAQHSRQVRTNVDVFVDATSQVRRWLATTPDTYRIGVWRSPPVPPYARVAPGDAVPDGSELIVLASSSAAGTDVDTAAALAASGNVGVTGIVAEPGLVDRRRVEPRVGVVAVAVSAGVLEEVGGLPPGSVDTEPALLERVRDAGHKISLRPTAATHRAALGRRDPIWKTPVVVFSAVPLHDIGGGGRGAQIALEFLRRGFHVTFVSLFGTDESVDLGLRFVHPALEQVKADVFSPQDLIERTETAGLVILEVPASQFREAFIALSEAGWVAVYDVIDDWSAPALGGEWYRPDIEDDFIARADQVIASAPDLVKRVLRVRPDARLIPNAVNADVFAAPLGPVPPPDLAGATHPLILYHGSLYGDWFDWQQLAAVATCYPDGTVAVIGDDKAPRPVMPPNVRFLGLKAQRDLPNYLLRADCGLIPFAVTDVTHAVSPLKAYEYMACGVPVAAPPLRALEGLDGIYTERFLPDAVAAALEGRPPDRDAALHDHSWGARLADLTRAIGWELVPIIDDGASVVSRLVVHYAKDQRRI